MRQTRLNNSVEQREKNQSHTHTHIYAEPSSPANQSHRFCASTQRPASGGKVLLDGQFDTSIKWQLWPQCACDVSSVELKGGKKLQWCHFAQDVKGFFPHYDVCQHPSGRSCGIRVRPQSSIKMLHSVKRSNFNVCVKPFR